MGASIALVFVTLGRVVSMAKITGKNDGVGGRNEHYRIGSKDNVPRREAVKEVERGKHDGYHIYERGGEKYVRDNPDSSKQDNVNK